MAELPDRSKTDEDCPLRELAFSSSLRKSISGSRSARHELLLSDGCVVSAKVAVIDEAVSEYSDKASTSRTLP